MAAALDCNSCLLGLRITNGTEWLQIGGRDDTFLPIVIKESQVLFKTRTSHPRFTVADERWPQHLTSAWTRPSLPSTRNKDPAAGSTQVRIVNPLFPATWSGLHISFLTPSILESSLHVIASIFPQPHLPFPLLISVGKIQIFSICFFYSSVVLDSSEGRSSQPLIDGSDFLEALTKKVDN